jgi:ATP-dependent RNA helicase RhlE
VTPTPVQAQSIPPAMEGRDVVATAQTGTGKTLAFALPIVDLLAKAPPTVSKAASVKAVILSPTRELALQINETIALLTSGTHVRSASVVGGMNEANQLKAIRRGAQIVVATPGRLCDFLDRRLIDLRGATTVVLDEADRMLDMGFLPSIRAILGALAPSRQTLLFSATTEKSVQHLIEASVRNPARVSIGVNTKPAEQVDLHHYEVEQNSKLGLLTHLLREESGAVLVFARTKRGTDRLASRMVPIACWLPPMSRPAASTSMASRTSSISTCRRFPRTSSIAPAVRAAPEPRASPRRSAPAPSAATSAGSSRLSRCA